MRRGVAGSSCGSLGPDCDEGLDVDLARIGAGEDPESVELQLLAQLEALGYEVERLAPDEDASSERDAARAAEREPGRACGELHGGQVLISPCGLNTNFLAAPWSKSL